MAFENLSEKLQGTFKKLKGKGVLTEADINEAMREVKLALLEADVNFKVVKEFVAEVKEKALGQGVLESLTPGQQVIKIVNDTLVDLMGGTNSKLTFSPSGFTVLLMVGLQGTGKTTTCGKLAAYLKKSGKKPMLAACDIYRPAAINQLKVVGSSINVEVFEKGATNPVKVAKEAVEYAKKAGKLITFDPNLRMPLWNTEDAAKSQALWGLNAADIVKISNDEVQFLFAQDPEQGAQYILQNFGVKLVFVTCGENGCFFANKRTCGHVPGIKGLKVIDTCGAGDIFGGSAVWKVLESGKDPDSLGFEELRSIVSFACATASLSTERNGGISSIPKPEEIEHYLLYS